MFSDELIGLDIAHRRELRNQTAQAQSVIDDMARDINRLRRELAAANRDNGALRLERGRRNNARLIARMMTTH